MDFEMKCRIGFGFEKPKSVHVCYIPLIGFSIMMQRSCLKKIIPS